LRLAWTEPRLKAQRSEVKTLTEKGGERLMEYDSIWKSGMEKEDMGTFWLHALYCVQAVPSHDRASSFIDHALAFQQVLFSLDQKLQATI